MLIDLDTGVQSTLAVTEKQFSQTRISEDWQYALAQVDGGLNIWSMSECTLIKRIETQDKSIEEAFFSNDGSVLLIQLDNPQEVLMLSLPDFRPVMDEPMDHVDTVHVDKFRLAPFLTRDNRFLFTVPQTNQIAVNQVDNAKQVYQQTFETDIDAFGLSENETFLWVVDNEGRRLTWLKTDFFKQA